VIEYHFVFVREAKILIFQLCSETPAGRSQPYAYTKHVKLPSALSEMWPHAIDCRQAFLLKKTVLMMTQNDCQLQQPVSFHRKQSLSLSKFLRLSRRKVFHLCIVQYVNCMEG
jgi:hypothetical protein